MKAMIRILSATLLLTVPNNTQAGFLEGFARGALKGAIERSDEKRFRRKFEECIRQHGFEACDRAVRAAYHQREMERQQIELRRQRQELDALRNQIEYDKMRENMYRTR